jgi:hypothetical protein
MLNIGPLWKEGVPFLLYCLLFHSWAKHLGVGFWSKIKEVEDPIEATCHNVHGKYMVSALSLYMHFITKKKRAKHEPHLLARFFPGYILCLMCGWCAICLTSFILFFIYFIISCIELVILYMKSKVKHYIIRDCKYCKICFDELFQWNIHNSLQIKITHRTNH